MSDTPTELAVQSTPPDIETSSAEYAARFSGPAGEYLLEVQDKCVEALVSGYSGGSIIDVGGGHGQLLGLYAQLGMKVTVQGSSDRCFARLTPDSQAYRRVVSNLNELPFEDQSFDVAVAVRLISHMDDWVATLTEMCRVARLAVVIDYPSKRSLNALTPLLFKLKRGIEKNTRTYTSFSHVELSKVFQSQGFTRITEHKQFFMPMVVHRMLGGGRLPRMLEQICRSIGLTRLLGSPIIMRAERSPKPM